MQTFPIKDKDDKVHQINFGDRIILSALSTNDIFYLERVDMSMSGSTYEFRLGKEHGLTTSVKPDGLYLGNGNKWIPAKIIVVEKKTTIICGVIVELENGASDFLAIIAEDNDKAREIATTYGYKVIDNEDIEVLIATQFDGIALLSNRLGES